MDKQLEMEDRKGRGLLALDNEMNRQGIYV